MAELLFLVTIWTHLLSESALTLNKLVVNSAHHQFIIIYIVNSREQLWRFLLANIGILVPFCKMAAAFLFLDFKIRKMSNLILNLVAAVAATRIIQILVIVRVEWALPFNFSWMDFPIIIIRNIVLAWVWRILRVLVIIWRFAIIIIGIIIVLFIIYSLLISLAMFFTSILQ